MHMGVHGSKYKPPEMDSLEHHLVSAHAFVPPACSYAKDGDVKLIESDTIAIYWFTVDKPCYTILYSHGNAEDIGQKKFWFRSLSSSTRCNLVAYDYSGFGRSCGTPTVQALEQNIFSVYNWLLKQQVAHDKIILYGRSIGSYPTLWLPSKVRKPAGIFLQSPLASIGDFIMDEPTIDFSALNNVAQLKQLIMNQTLPPVMILHGTEDEVINVKHADRV